MEWLLLPGQNGALVNIRLVETCTKFYSHARNTRCMKHSTSCQLYKLPFFKAPNHFFSYVGQYSSLIKLGLFINWCIMFGYACRYVNASCFTTKVDTTENQRSTPCLFGNAVSNLYALPLSRNPTSCKENKSHEA